MSKEWETALKVLGVVGTLASLYALWDAHRSKKEQAASRERLRREILASGLYGGLTLAEKIQLSLAFDLPLLPETEVGFDPLAHVFPR